MASFCAMIFLLALGVRLLHWQDARVEMERGSSLLTTLIKPYQREANRTIEEGGTLFPRGAVDPKDARMLVHPPGYSILTAAIIGYGTADNSYTRLRLLQVVCDAASVIALFLIAVELLPLAVAAIAGILVALSPHLSYYSLWLSPESLAALPVLLAVYLIIRANRRPRIIMVITAGALIGLSCWLRSNALLLAPFLALVIPVLFERGKRLRYSAVMVGAAIIVIAPITIRNWVVYRHFIPLSLGAGITMVEGIADYDTENRFNLPATDKEVALKDAEWHNRPDYRGNIWTPDGVERDRYRLSRGFAIMRSHPGWFFTMMLRRAAFMLRYNDSGPTRWPLNTAIAPVVSAEPTFGHQIRIAPDLPPVWEASPAELITNGEPLSSQAEVSIPNDGQTMQVIGDSSDYGDVFASAPIAIEKYTDYVFRLPVRLEQGPMAVKITSADRRIALVSEILPDGGKSAGKKGRKKAKKEAKDSAEETDGSDSTDEQTDAFIHMPFAADDNTEARLVISNDGQSSGRRILHAGKAELFKIGPTPHLWTRYARMPVRALQRNLFMTKNMVALIIIGLALLAIARRWRALAILLAVPLYYLCVQSALHTEYRYVLAIHYFLFVMAAATLYSLGMIIWQGMSLSLKRMKRKSD